jgi:hypothetical protein
MVSVSGLAMYDALKSATADLGAGSEFSINQSDAKDLAKLKGSDLVQRGYDEGIAERVSAALLNGDVEPLGKSMGLRLTIDPERPSLLS